MAPKKNKGKKAESSAEEKLKAEEPAAPPPAQAEKAAAPKKKAEVKAKAKLEAKPEAKAKADGKAKAEPKTEAQSRAKVESKLRPQEAPVVSKKHLESFLKNCITAMQAEDCRNKLKDPVTGRPGLALTEVQEQQWDELKVDRSVGRYAVDNVENHYPENTQLVGLRSNVIETAKNIYLRALGDRKPAQLSKPAKLSKETLCEFFDAYNIRLEQLDVVARLREVTAKTGDLAKEVTDEVQAEVFSLLGVDPVVAKERFETQQKELKDDSEFVNQLAKWQRCMDTALMDPMKAIYDAGQKLNCSEGIKLRIMEMVAMEHLTKLDSQERSDLLEKSGKKVQILRSLPPEKRDTHLSKLTGEEKIELIKAELTMVSIMQARQKQTQAQALGRNLGAFRPGTEFRTKELIKTIDKNTAAIAKNTLGRVLEVDTDNDLRVSIPSKGRHHYYIAQKDVDKLKISKEGFVRCYEGSVRHAVFGQQQIPVNITLTSEHTGVWSIVGQTADIEVEMKDDRIAFFENETRFEGVRKADGSFQGRVIQEGDANGSFLLRECA